jgi:Phage integrase, N-terminal SAM-like domain
VNFRMVRTYEKSNRYMVEIRFRWPEDRTWHRERVRSPVSSKSGSQRWGEERERALLRTGKAALLSVPEPKEVQKQVQTVREFAPEYVAKHHEANLRKRSTITTVEKILRLHLLPFIGDLPLDTVTDDAVANLRARWIKGGHSVGKRTVPGTSSQVTGVCGAARSLPWS